MKFKHLDLLWNYIYTFYTQTIFCLALLLKNYKIMYNLLWTLFKLNINMYMIILNAEKSACYQYESSKKRTTSSRVSYFHVKCHYLNYNRQVFDKVLTALEIRTFQGMKQINRLKTYLLKFCWDLEEILNYFARCDWQFTSLMSQHHVQYWDSAVQSLVMMTVSSMLM